MRALRVVAGLGILTASIAAMPQAKHPLAGKWNIEYERGRRNENGEVTVLMGKAALEIIEKGDSLIATLSPESAGEGRPAPAPSRLAGTGSGNSAKFTQTGQSRINMNGEERTVSFTTTWELKAEGDNLSGTSARAMADMPGMSTPAAVKGTRAK